MYCMSNLGKLDTLKANAPAGVQAFGAFDKAAMAAAYSSAPERDTTGGSHGMGNEG